MQRRLLFQASYKSRIKQSFSSLSEDRLCYFDLLIVRKVVTKHLG